MFALDSDYAFGVLTSRVHTEWAAKKSSTLEDRIRYTPTSAFETFPWPQTPFDEREHIAGAAREVLSRRSALCTEHGIGLGRLYDRVDDDVYTALAAAHRRLDEAVVAAYGWQPDLLDDLVARNRALYALNQQIVAGAVPYEPF